MYVVNDCNHCSYCYRGQALRIWIREEVVGKLFSVSKHLQNVFSRQVDFSPYEESDAVSLGRTQRSALLLVPR